MGNSPSFYSLLLVCQVFRSFYHLCVPSLASLQEAHISFVLGAQHCTRHSRVERKAHLPWHEGNALCNAAQDAVFLLCSEDVLLSHSQLWVHQETQDLFCSGHPVCLSWAYSSSGVAVCTSFFWSSCFSPLRFSTKDSSAILYHLQTCRGFTQLYHPGHY